jgi:hypothetical protein
LRACAPQVDRQHAKRPYSDEINARHRAAADAEPRGRRQLPPPPAPRRPGHPRSRPPASAYTPDLAHLHRPDGQPTAITIYNLQPQFINARDRVITNVDVLESNYDGVQFDLHKRMSNRWQMLAGCRCRRTRASSTAAPSPTRGDDDFNNPNYRLNRDNGRCSSTCRGPSPVGQLQLPFEVVFSGKYTGARRRPADRTRTFSATDGVAGPSETVWVQQRGEDRTENVTKFVDIRCREAVQRRPIAASRARCPGVADLFNVLNANHVLLNQTDRRSAPPGAGRRAS